eukprot:jgi/Botrbrau1/9496/Bobra.0252s0111.1
MKFRMSIASVLPALVVVLFFPSGSVGNTCDDVMTTLNSLPACQALQTKSIEAGLQAADLDCKGSQTVGRKFFDSMPPECCDPLRIMVEEGCVCDLEFQQTAAGIQGIPDEQLPATFRGLVNLLQASTCTTPEMGGPFANPCDGAVNVCAASARKLLSHF